MIVVGLGLSLCVGLRSKRGLSRVFFRVDGGMMSSLHRQVDDDVGVMKGWRAVVDEQGAFRTWLG